MNRKKILSAVLAAAVMLTVATGCAKQDEDAVKLSEEYLDTVLDADFEAMAKMLEDKEDVEDYEIDERSLTGLTAVLDLCDHEQTEYTGGKNEISIEYTLTLPDVSQIEDNEYDSFTSLVDSLGDLDETEYKMEITLVAVEDEWMVKDPDSALELYEDILEGLAGAEFDYVLGYEGVLAVLEEELPNMAEELSNSNPSGGEYNITDGGVQVVIGTYNNDAEAYEMFSFIAECHTGELPSEDEHYCYLEANGHASGILWRENVVVHIYDLNGTHEEEVNNILEELQEML